MADAIERLLQSTETLLRYVAPGFVAMIVVAVSDRSKAPEWYNHVTANPWLGVLLAVLAGFLIYAAHRALLEDLTCMVTVAVLRRVFPHEVPSALTKASSYEIVQSLPKEHLKRRASGDPFPNDVQRDLDSLGATLSFLFCSSYAAIGIPLLMVTTSDLLAMDGLRAFVFVSGFVLLLLAFACDVRYMRLDLWAMREHPMP